MTLLLHQRLAVFLPSPPLSGFLFPCRRLRYCRNQLQVFLPSRLSRRRTPFLCTAKELEEKKEGYTVEEKRRQDRDMDHFVEVGYISKVHGLQGELRVKPTTDFPHLRFSKPGKRWLRARVSGEEVISEVELKAGRDHPAQKSWIISIQGIDTVDQAKQIVGSTLLVKVGDRPVLEEGEFYSPDLVGMSVILKETGRQIGVVANVFNYGASDLLQVILNSAEETIDHSNSSKSPTGSSGQVVWVPFVEAIVPEVDIDKREMCITPPKGLLELNLRTDTRSKKERRQLEWKERKKLLHRLTAVKRKLADMGQNHILDCLKVRDKAQKDLLINQIVKINFKLFQHAVCSISQPLDKFNLPEFIDANSAVLQENSCEVSSKFLSCVSNVNNLNHKLHNVGLQILLKSKAAIVLISNDEMTVANDSVIDVSHTGIPETKLLHLQELIVDIKRLLEVEIQELPSIPVILVSPSHEIQSYEEFFADRNHFGIDTHKVWVLEEEKLPIVSPCPDSQKILMRSSCEILQAPTGSGGVFSSLSSHSIPDKLIEIGVEYVQICSLGGRSRPAIIESSLLFGLVNSRGADIGISVLQGEMEKKGGEFNMVLSLKHLNKICKQVDALSFSPVPERHEHMELVQLEGANMGQTRPTPESSRSYRLHSCIYSSLRTCSPHSICILYVI